MGQGPQPGGPGEEGRCALLGALAVKSEQTGGGPSGWLPQGTTPACEGKG